MSTTLTFFSLLLTTAAGAKTLFYVQVHFFMEVSVPAMRNTTASVQDCVDLAAQRDDVKVIMYKGTTCYGYTGIGGYTYRSEKGYGYVRMEGCLKTSTINTERLLVDVMYGESICTNVSGKYLPARVNTTYDVNSGYCQVTVSRGGKSPTVRQEPYVNADGFPNWMVGRVVNKTSGNMTNYVMTRGQVTNITRYTCQPYVGQRTIYNNRTYCFNETDSFSSSETTSKNYCADVFDGGKTVEFIHPLLYTYVFGYRTWQNATAFAGLLKNDQSGYSFVGSSSSVNITSLNWKSGYPKGGKFVMMNSDYELEDMNGPFNSTIKCMSDPVLIGN
ncbi:unnamed protein product [Bursaphelenchus xylophilus]|uniref:(pine wood nematode) hypothetical protein n=1 Tax=Bursaphelenchus xylophilus TaxID=6326 RepID=A0A1I7RM01_BURXY|nr:unnamed protein product [Bursaphelenchus xylophilus]CAG9113405.1 unnamed protein product [Bursaphelenchus xylophilus]